MKKRKLYKIGHVTKLLGLTSRTIRYYDQFGLLPQVKRSDGNVRLFDDEDIELIKRIRRYQKEDYLPLEAIRERLFNSDHQTTPSQYVVVTDGGASIPSLLVEALNIEVVPIGVSVGEEDISLDGKHSVETIWKSSEKMGYYPRTVAPDVDAFVDTYERLKSKGYQKIYSIHTGAYLSDTYQSALSASHKVSDRIDVEVIDSKTISSGLGLLVRQVAEAIQDHKTLEEIELLISKELPLAFKVISADSLLYMYPGLHVDADSDVKNEPLLTQLNTFKPLILFKGNADEIEVLEIFKDRPSTSESMLELLSSEIVSRGKYIKEIVVTYNYLFGEAMELVNLIKNEYPNYNVTLEAESPVVSVYTGPKSIGIGLI